MLLLAVLVIAEDGEPFRGGISRNDAELVTGITMGGVDDAEILCRIIAVFSIEKDKDILALARLPDIWHGLLEMPSDGFAVAIQP